ncbi:oligoendopeptidase F [Cytobacillus gottheilii]|uniref:oligoendopeptidase F n=1 Tax=Cytobacillus gottheilii TaxID=859144 RepID=UPI0009B95FAB|nr:oligoendopeptidase F [Cytobacillus gottheilii]
MEQTVTKRLHRSEVPEKLTWDLTALFSSHESWQKAITAIENSLPEITSYKGKLNESSDTLYECLLSYEKLLISGIQAFTYASLKQSGDGTDPENQADSSVIASLQAQVNASLSFIESEILLFPDGKVEEILQNEERFAPFARYLTDLLDSKKHRLSPETEEALASLGEVHGSPYRIYNAAKLVDMPFEDFTDEDGNVLQNSFALFEDKYEFSPKADVRRNAFKSFSSTLHHYKNTFAATYSAEVKKQVALSKLRGYESVTQMLLDPQNVTEEMYHNQLDIIQTELAPHMRKFASLKKRILGLDEMHFADLKAPLDPDFNPNTTYEEACDTILESLKVMGPEYSEIMKKGLTDRWVDLSDNIGKSTGAFCSSPYGAHPYILMTWTDTMRGAFVLAHELGHAGHFYLANKEQRVMNTRPSTYFVEAPSTLNELLLAQHLMSNTNDVKMKRWVILQLLGTYYHNFVTHLLEGAFQRRVYDLAEKGIPLTAAKLCAEKKEVLSSFWGDEVIIDDDASLTWMRQPHYYMGLYPYTYSAGLTASTAMAIKIQENGTEAVESWLNVLKAGGTKKPLDLLQMAGIDMSQPEPIKSAVHYVGTLIQELEDSFQ